TPDRTKPRTGRLNKSPHTLRAIATRHRLNATRLSTELRPQDAELFRRQAGIRIVSIKHPNEWSLLAEADGFEPRAPASLVMRSVNDEGLARLTIQTSRNQAPRCLLIVGDYWAQAPEIEPAPPEGVTGDLSYLFNDPGVFRRAVEHPPQRQAAIGAEDF